MASFKLKFSIPLLGLSFLVFSTVGKAQPLPKLEELTLADGLSQGYVKCLLQDKEGFIWLGTKNGLNRYDGSRIKTFTPNPFDSTAISTDRTNIIGEYDHYLLLGYVRGGIDVFDKRSQWSYRLHTENDPKGLLVSCAVQYAGVDKDGQLWAVVNGVTHLTLVKMTFPQGWPSRPQKYKATVKMEEVFSIHRDECKTFYFDVKHRKLWWIGTSLKCFDTNTTTIQSFGLPSYLWQDTLSDIHVSADEIVWLASGYRITQFRKGKWQTTATDFEVKILGMSPNSDLLVCRSKTQLTFVKRSALNQSNLTEKDIFDRIKLTNRTVLGMIADRSGIWWLGTSGYGVIKYNPGLQRFKLYYQGTSINSPLVFVSPGEVVYYNQGNLTAPKAINQIPNRFPGNSKLYVYNVIGNPEGGYWAIYKRDDEIVLASSPGNGQWEPALTFNLEFRNLIQLATDDKGNVFIATSGKLLKFDPKKKTTTAFDFSDYVDYVEKIYDMMQTPNGYWWMATSNGLLRAISKEQGFDFQLFKVVPFDDNSLQNDDISCLMSDLKNPDLLWIGTRGGGLNNLDMKTMKFSHITSADGLPNDVIYGILPDDRGNLWLSSNKGIISYNPATKSIRNFTVADGLPANEFNSLAYKKGPDGAMYFGSVDGLVAFDPADFKDNPVLPELRLTALEINNQLIRYGDDSNILPASIEFADKITLPYAKNSITLEMAALEFSIPSKNKIKYYLKGLEPEWAHVSAEKRASYLNLPPGHFTFIAKACNNDGVWNDTPTILKITVLPPWYRTTLAYVIYAALFFAVFYGIFRFFLNRQRLRHKLVLEQKEAERLKELDEFKSKFFTNITHEFRTPLTIIQGMADEVIHPEGQSLARLKNIGRMIKKNGTNLLQLINQILDLAKLEANSLQLNPMPTELVEFIKYLTGSFESAASHKDIQLTLHAEVPQIYTSIDRDRLQTIFANLLSNAIQFTPENGAIDVKIQQAATWEQLYDESAYLAAAPSKNHSGDWLALTIQDSGAGIDKAQVPYVFDRFFQADNQQFRDRESTGIGLALVKELVMLMGGGIAVSSILGEGTSFGVFLPVVITLENVSFTLLPADNEREAVQGVLEKATVPELEDPAENNLPTLLLIEDNTDVLQYLIYCVRDFYKVLTAQNGQEGIGLALEAVPDIIVSDVMMPLKNGFEVTNTLKNDERTSHIPIILLTAKTDDGSRIEGLERGADAYLSKPFNKNELLVRLRKLLELRRKLQQRYSNGEVLVQSSPDSLLAPDNFEDKFIVKLQEVLQENLPDENFGVHELCRALGMSRTQLHNKIKALTGKSTTNYIRSFRLQKAKDLLLTSDLSISEIAFEVGFRHAQNFSTYFSEEFGHPPSMVRK